MSELKKKEWDRDGEPGGEEERSILGSTRWDDGLDDYEDSDEHEIEDSTTTPLAIFGSFLLGAGCFIGIPSCLGIPFFF
jgi:hypothetical protein